VSGDGAGTDCPSTLARRIEAVRVAAAGQSRNAETGSQALFRMGTIGHDHLVKGGNRGTELRGLGQHPRRAPVGMTPMRRGHVLGQGHVAAPPVTARVAGNPLPFMEYLDDGATDADIHLFPDQAEGHGIPGTVERDVTIGGTATFKDIHLPIPGFTHVNSIDIHFEGLVKLTRNEG